MSAAASIEKSDTLSKVLAKFDNVLEETAQQLQAPETSIVVHSDSGASSVHSSKSSNTPATMRNSNNNNNPIFDHNTRKSDEGIRSPMS